MKLYASQPPQRGVEDRLNRSGLQKRSIVGPGVSNTTSTPRPEGACRQGSGQQGSDGEGPDLAILPQRLHALKREGLLQCLRAMGLLSLDFLNSPLVKFVEGLLIEIVDLPLG